MPRSGSLRRRAVSRRGFGRQHVIISAAALAAAGAVYGADVVSTFKNGTSNWDVTTAWSPTGIPKNGAQTFDAIFNGTYYGVSGDTLKLDLNVALQKFTMTGGYFVGPDSGGPYTLTLNDTLQWSGGIVGPMTMVLNAGGAISATSTCNLAALTLDNHATLSYTATFTSTPDGQFPLRMDNSSLILNEPGATFNIAGNGGISVTSAAPRINNQGLWVKSAGTGVSSIEAGFLNTGTVRSASGTLQFLSGTNQFSGTLEVLAGATLGFDSSSTTVFESDSTLSGAGALQFGGNTLTFGGAITGGGALQIHNNTRTSFVPSADLTSFGATNGGRALQFVQQGTASFDTGHAVTIYNLSSDNSFTPASNASIFMTGGDDFVLNGPANWTGGTMSAPTTNAVNLVTVNSGMTISGAGLGLDHRNMVINSALNLNGGFMQLKHGANIQNNAGGVLTLLDNTHVDWAGPTSGNLPMPTVTNAGLIIKSGGTGEAQFNDARLLNTGTVRVLSGMLTLNQTGYNGSGGIGQLDSGVNSGTFEISAGATLNVSQHTMDPNSIVGGAGTMMFRGNVNVVQGTYNVTGATSVFGGLDFQSGATVTNVGQTLSIPGGVTFNTGKPVALHDVVLVGGGSLGGSDPITIAGTLSGNGTFNGSNLIATGNISPGNSPGALTLSGGLTLEPSSQLNIELASGAFDQVSSTGTVALGGHLVLSLLSGYIPKPTDQFIVVTSGAALSGQFDDVLSGQRLGTADGTGSFVVNYGTGSPNGANRVVLTSFAVPEPAGIAFIGLAGTILTVRRRRSSYQRGAQ